MNTELEQQQPGYYSILTASVRYDKDLNANEKILFSEITALSNKYGYCTASNKYFSNLFQADERSIRRWISNLKQHGYIKMNLITKDKEIIARRIYPMSGGGDRNVRGYGQKCPEGGDRNVLYNNTSNNNTSNNNNILSGKEPDPEEKENSEITQKTDDIPYDRVIKYLNAKAGTNYRATNKATQRLIKARFNEGMTTKDFKKVIDNKCNDWLKDPKMCEFLRPATLFGSKFESYLNQKPKRLDQSATDWHEYSTRADTDTNVSSDNAEPKLSAEELDKIFNSFGKSENT